MDKVKARSRLAFRFNNFFEEHRLQFTFFLIGVLIIFLRKPDAVLTPQFWAEDGSIFFTTAYNHGFSIGTLIKPFAGYFQVLPRSLSLLGGIVSLKYMPLAFALAAIFVQALPLLYLWGPRGDNLVKNRWVKLLITALYLCLPYTQEISSNATNAQWYLVISAFIILFLAESKHLFVRTLDYLILFLSGLSGPFAIFLAPIAFVEWYHKRQKVNQIRFGILAVCALATGFNLLFSNSNRGVVVLGASLSRFLDIVGAQVYAAGLFGPKISQKVLNVHYLAPLIAIIATAILIYICFKAPRALWMLVLLGTVVLLSALIFPARSPKPSGEGFWRIMLTTGAGDRYYFLLHFSIFICLVWTFFSFNNFTRYASGLLLVLSAFIGIAPNFRYAQNPNLHYQIYVSQVQRLKKGQSIWIPINPQPGWGMQLIKQ